jgi:hypothetical protein
VKRQLITQITEDNPRVYKEVRDTLIEIGAILIRPEGVYRRVIVICGDDLTIRDWHFHHLLDRGTSLVKVKFVSKRDLKTVVMKALEVKTYTDFRELLKLINHTKPYRDRRNIKPESALCHENHYKLLYSSYIPPEILGWRPEYLNLKAQ